MPFFPFVFFLFSLQTDGPLGVGTDGPLRLPDYAWSFQRGDYAGAATLAADLIDPGANPRP